MTTRGARRLRLAECLDEVTQRIGPSWNRYRLVGATREGLAPAKEGVGKAPERYKLVEPGTIFYNPMRILLGSIALLEEHEEPAITSPDYVVFKTRASLVHPRWFYYWLRSDDGAAFIRSLARGAVRERMLFRRLAQAEIEVPSYDVQLEFARMAVLLERARAAAENQLETVNALPAAYLRTIFASQRAKSWPTKKLQEIGDPRRGDTVQTGPFGAQLPSSDFVSEGVPVLNIGNVQWGYLDLSRLDHVTAKKARGLERYRVCEGDLLFTRSGTVGRCAVVPRGADGWLISYHLLRVALDQQSASPSFVAAAIRGCRLVQEQVRLASKRGATRDGVNTAFLSGLELPLPPIEVQQEIVRGLAMQLDRANRLHEEILQTLNAIVAFPRALLSRAFSGGPNAEANKRACGVGP